MHTVTMPKKNSKAFSFTIEPIAIRGVAVKKGCAFKDKRRKAKVNDRVSLKSSCT